MDNRPIFTRIHSLPGPYSLLLIMVCGCLFYLPAAYYYGVRDASSLPKTILISLTGCSCLLIYYITGLKQKTSRLDWSPLFSWALLFISWSVLSYSWSRDPAHAQIELSLLLNIALFAWLCFLLVHRGYEELLVVAVVTGTTLPAIIGILQYFNINPIGYMQFGTPAATFINKNIAANFFELVLPVSFIMMILADSRKARLLSCLVFAVLLLYLVLVHSRGAWLGLAVASLTSLFLISRFTALRSSLMLRINNIRWLVVFCLSLPLLVLLVSNTFIEHRQFQQKAHSFLTASADSSAKIRLNSYLNALSMVKEKPITGYGAGSFRMEFRSHMFDVVPMEETTELKELTRLHSEPLQILLELGVTGLILFLAVLITAAKYSYALLQADIPDRTRLLVLGLSLGLVSSLVHSLLSYTFRIPASALLFSVWLAVIAALYHRHIREQHLPLPRYVSLIAICSILFFTFYNLSFYSRYWQASRLRLNIESALFLSECQHTRQYAQEVMEKFALLFHHRRAYLQAILACGTDSEKLDALNRILAYEPGNTYALYERGRYYLLSQQPQLAMADFEKVIQRLPHRPASYYGLASSFMAMGSREQADEVRKIAEKLDKKPTKSNAINGLNRPFTLQ